MIDGIVLKHFSPPVTIEKLRQSNCREVTTGKGVYVILRPNKAYDPIFVQESTAGWYQGLDPNYQLEFVEKQWVEEALILYVGKAGGKRGLRRRIRDFVRFGNGEPVAHRGGRLIWHLKNSHTLCVRWFELPTDNPREFESILISDFRDVHGKRPFANLRN